MSFTLGTNLYPVKDWSPELPFANCFKQARPFCAAGIYGGCISETLTKDADGYPTSLADDRTAVTYLFSGSTNHPTGEYTFLYDGEGTFKINQGGAFLENGNINVTGGLLVFRITSTNPADPVRNLRLILPGHTEDDTFNKQFLVSMAPYKAIRFMNWFHINSLWNSQTESLPGWGATTNFTYADSQGGSVPIEVCLELCTLLGAVPWFNIHHAASDEYIQTFATATSEVSAFFEYSNELWNGIYRQVGYVRAIGEATGLTGWNALKYGWANRLDNLISLVQGEAHHVILAGQAAGVDSARQVLGLMEEVPDSCACAPYFYDYGTKTYAAISAAMSTSLEWVQEWIDFWVTENGRNLGDLLIYECGQHIIGHNEIQNESWMGTLYTDYFTALETLLVGCKALCHFTNISPWDTNGAWGTSSNLYNLDTYKRNALIAFAEEEAPPVSVTLESVAGQVSALYAKTEEMELIVKRLETLVEAVFRIVTDL